MRDKEKEVKDLINELNEETKRIRKEVTDKVNEDESLGIIGKMSKAYEMLETRYRCIREIQNLLRDNGWDIKMNMQNYELSYYGRV